MPTQAERAARNEALFREVNEHIKTATEDFESPIGSFLCECSEPSCVERISLTLREYEAVRAHGDRFALVVGHDDPAVERVVEENSRFAVVAKFGEGASVAEELDPRRRNA
jgi:hypothetical protein